MAATTDIIRERWPRDVKLFALFALLWAAWLTARIVMRDVSYSTQAPLEAVLLGMKFEGYLGRLVLVAEAMAVFILAFGLLAEQKWALFFALVYLAEIVVSNLIFMLAYMDDLAEGSNVRIAGLVGVVSVLILLYLWVHARYLLFDENAPG